MATFVDTSALFALLDADDERHAEARSTFERLIEAGEPLISHSHVVVESAALAQRRLGLEAVRLLHDGLLAVVAIEWVTQEQHEQAVATLLTAGRREVSLVDHLSFLLMRRRRIERTFAFDAHFLGQGFAPA